MEQWSFCAAGGFKAVPNWGLELAILAPRHPTSYCTTVPTRPVEFHKINSSPLGNDKNNDTTTGLMIVIVRYNKNNHTCTIIYYDTHIIYIIVIS
jgi:hypothetical protein